MAKITHPNLPDTVVEVPDRVAPFWTGRGGWRPADASKAGTSRRSSRPAPKSTPAPAGVLDGPPSGASTSDETEE